MNAKFKKTLYLNFFMKILANSLGKRLSSWKCSTRCNCSLPILALQLVCGQPKTTNSVEDFSLLQPPVAFAGEPFRLCAKFGILCSSSNQPHRGRFRLLIAILVGSQPKSPLQRAFVFSRRWFKLLLTFLA